MSWAERAAAVMPGGVNSPVRAFRAVDADPVYVAGGRGPWIEAADGRRLIDLVCSWGALLLGHADPRVVEAVTEAARRGTSFGLPTPQEVELAEKVTRLVPSVEMVRMVNSGTEATAAAVRLARAATGRDVVVKFEGCYHGHADGFLVEAGSGAATFGVPNSPGVPAATASTTRVARYNDLESVEEALASGDVACVIVEPVAGNMGVVPPRPGFLQGLREACDRHDTLLVFDEVITGFRLGPGGAQQRYGVIPDLTCLGKVLGGGTPAGAYGGRGDLMRMVSPDGPVYQAGTLAGNPLVVAAGIATLEVVEEDPDLYRRLDEAGARLEGSLQAALGRDGCVQRVGSMLTVFFGPREVADWRAASGVDRDRFRRFFRAALDRDVLVPPSPFESMFLTLSHLEVIDQLVGALTAAVEESA
ncbi:MAG: glutamate-1-semialdehyde 2,1-aminomutase [Acidimicrobiia bacterium]|nr:MAG: glutamate-1-semialdehyde 2,1-aminomutase [Acidimicrobiia bacterium]